MSLKHVRLGGAYGNGREGVRTDLRITPTLCCVIIPRLCSSPTIEAVEMVDKLGSRDERVLKMATYTLQRLIREKPFSVEFLKRGGLVELVGIIRTFNSGNTLAYALTSCQNLMEGSDSGWEDLDGPFIAKVR